jgi:hypothetical protein
MQTVIIAGSAKEYLLVADQRRPNAQQSLIKRLPEGIRIMNYTTGYSGHFVE